MEYVFELIFELIFEGAGEIVNDTKKPKPLRIIAGCLVAFWVLAVVLIIGVVAIVVMSKYIVLGIVLLVVDLFMIVYSVKKFIKVKNNR